MPSDGLAIGAEDGESERVLVEDLKEPSWDAAVLDIRLHLSVRSDKVEYFQVREALGKTQIQGDCGLPSFPPFHSDIASARTRLSVWPGPSFATCPAASLRSSS
jgi:hypothetical protein